MQLGNPSAGVEMGDGKATITFGTGEARSDVLAASSLIFVTLILPFTAALTEFLICRPGKLCSALCREVEGNFYEDQFCLGDACTTARFVPSFPSP